MSHAHNHDPTVPKEALIGAGALLACVLALTASVSWGWVPQSANPELERVAAQVQPATQRDLRFADRADGAVVVTDAATGSVVKIIGYGEEGFTRATIRRLAKLRSKAGIGRDMPFTLTKWENGALSLTDPATGESAELQGYGPDHTANFEALLQGAAE
jgi:putative photosynthetic complex assembly protein